MLRKGRTRRSDLQRRRANGKPSAWRSLRAHHRPTPLLIGFGLFAASTAVILAGGQTMSWQRDQRVPSDVRARVAFAVTDEKLTDDNRRQARLKTPNVYVRNEALLDAISGRLREIFELAKSSPTAERFIEAAKRWEVTETNYNELKALAGDAGAQFFEFTLKQLRAFLADRPVVEKADDPRRTETPESALLTWTQPERGERPVVIGQLQYVSDEDVVRRLAERAVGNLPPQLRSLQPVVSRVIAQSLRPEPDRFEPIYRYDAQATAELIKRNEDAVQRVVNSYNPGDVLVKAGTTINDAELDLLKKEHEAYRAALSTDARLWRERVLMSAGTATTVLLVIAGLAIYTLLYQYRSVEHPTRALGLSALLLCMLAIARLNALMLWPNEFAVATVVVAAAILTIAWERRYALGVTAGLAILATLATEGNLGLFITLLVPMSITVFVLKDIRTRGKLIGTGAMAGLGAFVAATADGLIGRQNVVQYVLPHAGYAAVAALLAGFIVLGVLPAIERLFGVATGLTLLEWGDASRPLLRRLAEDAPGTYTHSLMIGTVAEAAADAIGANGLLTRVGALYHDLGKIAKPEYFVENQEAKINRHDRLGPTLSLLVIVAHVKDGLELAKEYGLPRVLHQFIAEHHGTTVVRYFQRVAAEQAIRKKTRELPESEFRYPGPKPRSRESAILMICDGAEGMVRAMPEPTPGRIEGAVHQIVMDRLNDGQFDDCDITMKDLSRVEDAIVKGLCAAYHGRIAYPKGPSKDDRPSPPTAETAEQRQEEMGAPAMAAGSSSEVAPP